MPLDTPLAKLIAGQIQEGGPISFRDFVELALYHPELGYYTRPQANFGKEGDFFTSPHAGPLFGWTLGRAMERAIMEMEGGRSERRGRDLEPFCITEFGPGKGFLAWDVMEYLRTQNPPLFERLRYVLVEQSPSLRRVQQSTLERNPDFKKRSFWCSADELEPARGMVLANEFVDALPFHRVLRTESGYREIYVGVLHDEFVERHGPLTSSRLEGWVDVAAREFTAGRGAEWPVGQQMEISLDAFDWIASLAQWVQAGQIFVIDYGEEMRRWPAGQTSRGTVKAFFRHQLSDRFYEHVGAQDLTADVNFSLLRKVAENLGFTGIQFLTQADFLQQNGILEITERRAQTLHLAAEEARAARRQILNLILPEMMGTRFKVLVLRREGM